VTNVTHEAHEQHQKQYRKQKQDRKRSQVTGSRAFVTGRLFTVAEVAAAMRVSNMTVYRLIRSGELPALRVGKGYRIFEADLERFLEGRSVHVEGG
jgi:excisionase family DNA binding protein